MKITTHAQSVNLLRLCVDMTVVVLFWMLAYSIRFQWGIIELSKGLDTFLRYAQLIPELLFSYLFVFTTTGIYQRSFVRAAKSKAPKQQR